MPVDDWAADDDFLRFDRRADAFLDESRNPTLQPVRYQAPARQNAPAAQAGPSNTERFKQFLGAVKQKYGLTDAEVAYLAAQGGQYMAVPTHWGVVGRLSGVRDNQVTPSRDRDYRAVINSIGDPKMRSRMMDGYNAALKDGTLKPSGPERKK